MSIYKRLFKKALHEYIFFVNNYIKNIKPAHGKPQADFVQIYFATILTSLPLT